MLLVQTVKELLRPGKVKQRLAHDKEPFYVISGPYCPFSEIMQNAFSYRLFVSKLKLSHIILVYSTVLSGYYYWSHPVWAIV